MIKVLSGLSIRINLVCIKQRINQMHWYYLDRRNIFGGGLFMFCQECQRPATCVYTDVNNKTELSVFDVRKHQNCFANFELLFHYKFFAGLMDSLLFQVQPVSSPASQLLRQFAGLRNRALVAAVYALWDSLTFISQSAGDNPAYGKAPKRRGCSLSSGD